MKCWLHWNCVPSGFDSQCGSTIYVQATKKKTERERIADRRNGGIFRFVTTSYHRRGIPVWIHAIMYLQVTVQGALWLNEAATMLYFDLPIIPFD